MSNWTEKIVKLQNTLETWKKRNLTIFGKITIIKTLALSKIIYSVMNTHIPPDTIPKINKLIYNFIWGAKERIKRMTLIGPIDEGGVNMVTLDNHFTSLKATWVQKIIDSNETWSFIGKKCIKNFGDNNLLLYTNNPENDYIKTIPIFYQQVLLSHMKLNNAQYDEQEVRKNILNNTIWHNKHITTKIRRKNQPLYFKNWIEAGILFIKDLKFKNGTLDENHCYKSVKKKQNILAETLIVKNAVAKYKVELQKVNYQNNEPLTLPEHMKLSAQRKTSMLNRGLFIEPKFNLIKNLKPDIKKTEIKKILTKKVKREQDKKIAEFHYKFLTDTLITANILSKWKEGVPERCVICKEIDNTNHLLFSCPLARNTWRICEEALEIIFSPTNLILSNYQEETSL